MLEFDISRDFDRFIKSISDSNSKQGIDRIVSQELALLKLNFQNKHLTKKQIFLNLKKCLYIEMLGYSTKFAYIHAINMAQDRNIKYKSLGYLCCTLMLNNQNDLVILLINTIQKDLNDINMVNKYIVLNNLCYIINEEMLPIVLPLVLNCLNHENELIRKKTFTLLITVLDKYPHFLQDNILHIIEKGIYDVNPSVMNVSLKLLMLYLERFGSEGLDELLYINIVINIWKQILDNKLNRTYYYSRIPAPFVQVNIMKILARLCQNNVEYSNAIYNVLYKFIQYIENYFFSTSDPGSERNVNPEMDKIGSKVVVNKVNIMLIYEFIKLLSNLHVNNILLNISSLYISKLLNNNSVFVNYISIKCINLLYSKDLSVSSEDQMKLLGLLGTDDSLIQSEILRLLYKLINPGNYRLILNNILKCYESAILPKSEKTEVEREVLRIVGGSSASNLAKFNVKVLLKLLLSTDSSRAVLYQLTDLVQSTLNFEDCVNLLNKCKRLYKSNDNVKLLLIWLINHLTRAGEGEDLGDDLDQILAELLQSKIGKTEDLHWIYNNYRYIVLSKGCKVGVGRVSRADVISQIVREVRHLTGSGLKLETNNRSYDISLSFLKDFVEGDKRVYRREVKASKVEVKAESENNLIYKPYIMISDHTSSISTLHSKLHTDSNSVENSVRDGVEDSVLSDKIVLERANSKSWGPKGYISFSSSSQLFNTTQPNLHSSHTSSNSDNLGDSIKYSVENSVKDSEDKMDSGDDKVENRNERLAKQLFQNLSAKRLESDGSESVLSEDSSDLSS